jgi:hypothetical protein
MTEMELRGFSSKIKHFPLSLNAVWGTWWEELTDTNVILKESNWHTQVHSVIISTDERTIWDTAGVNLPCHSLKFLHLFLMEYELR